MMNVFVGIDIGKNGAITGITDSGNGHTETASIVTPVLPNGDIDVDRFADELRRFESTGHLAIIAIEKVHAIFGSSAGATFEFGRSAGIVEGIVKTMRLPHVMVAPKEWQKEMWSGVDKVKKSGKNSTDTKATSLIAVKRLFPKSILSDQSKPRSTKNHDGIVDSILIAEYGRRLWRGQKA